MAAKGIVRLTDLDDFIAPSQACIKPIAVASEAARARVITYEGDDLYEEVDELGRKKTLKPVSITLNDCLACSGCITSSEAVLIEKQGPDELLSFVEHAKMEGPRWLFVATVSPQSKSSIATHYELSMDRAERCIRQFFKKIGVDLVLDSTFARNLSLIATGMEFVERYKAWQASSSSKDLFPMICGSCPGWICYAEKSVGDLVIPLISKARSPQAISGAIVKDYLLQMLRDLKCSYAEGQLCELIDRKCPDFKYLQMDDDPEWLPFAAPQYRHSGSGSGGYLDFVFKYAAKELFNIELETITYHIQKNNDLQEVYLDVNDQRVLTMALCYGFKNIQNLIRKILVRTVNLYCRSIADIERWLGDLNSEKAKRFLRTQYEALKENDSFSFNVQW
ncbi:cytosolic Fe S cluster assembly factor [Trichuris trichiura]|uniref:Cytosolic Fe S cluster assembly factor n=1 Tax=Trichuris trichiura TaxID=36087 RepID=A0A077Z635_TRITR|nr:cytosolic Fe S cluster assembly factor [Trichuris trichiura]